MKSDHTLQTTLSVYGDGPFDSELGRTTGCQDVATIHIDPAFALIRTADYKTLQSERIETQSLCRTIKANVLNPRLSDAAFREFVGRSLA